MDDKALGLLGLMRKAGAVQLGEDKALDAVQTGKVRLLLLSADASDRARRHAEAMQNGRRFQLIETHYSRETLGEALGVGNCAMAAVTELGFANALMKELAAQQPERYAGAAEETARRLDKADRRKRETAERKGSKRNVKRRTEV